MGAQDGPADVAQFYGPRSVAADAQGNIYVSDYFNAVVRKIGATGTVSTLAGTAGVRGSADGAGAAARFQQPAGLAVSVDGTVYVADSLSAAVRRISTAGEVTTVAGRLGEPGLQDGPREVARLANPLDVALDGTGTLFVLDAAGVRRVDLQGVVTTVVALPISTNARALAVGPDGALYVGASRLSRYTATGAPLPWPSTGSNELAVPSSGLTGLGMASDGSVLVTVSIRDVPRGTSVTMQVLRIAPDGRTTTIVAGTQLGNVDGPVAQARFNDLADVAQTPNGEIVVADMLNHSVRAISPEGLVRTVAGGNGAGDADGQGVAARFAMPRSITAGPDGQLYVGESGFLRRRLRRVSADGAVVTPPSTGTLGADAIAFDEAGRSYVALTDGIDASIEVRNPDGSLNARVESASVDNIDNVTPAGAIVFARNVSLDIAVPQGQVMVLDRPNATPRVLATGFLRISSISVNAAGDLYVADDQAHTVSKVAFATGQVTVIAGARRQPGTVDGAAAQARLDSPSAVLVASTGEVYFSDRARALGLIAGDGSVRTLVDAAKLPASVIDMAWLGGSIYAIAGNAIYRFKPGQ